MASLVKLMVDLRSISWALAAVLAVSTVASAADRLRPTCGGVFHLCGYEDAKGTIIIPRRFQMARGFQHGLAAVRLNGLWGFIEPSGDIAIRPAFLAVGDFYGERAEAASNEGVGVIDREGAFTIPPRFDRAIPFTNDVALVTERSDLPASKILWKVGRDNSFNSFGRHYAFRLFHRRDGWLTERRHNFRWFHRPGTGTESFIWATETQWKSPFGLMDDSGSWVVEPSFEEVGSLDGGFARIRRGLWGAVDENGEIAIPLKFHSLSNIRNGYAVIGGPGPYKLRKYGLIRLDGTVLAEPEFDEAVLPSAPGELPSAPGELPRVRRNEIWYWFDTGELIPIISTNNPEGTLVASCPQGLRVILRADGYHLTDAEGNPTLKEPVEHVSSSVSIHEGSNSRGTLLSRGLYCWNHIVVSIGNYGESNWRGTFIRTNGRSLFEPSRFFTSLSNFSHGRHRAPRRKP